MKNTTICIISALGGSRVQIGGPTGAFIVIIYGIIQQFGVGGLAIATIMAGVMLVLSMLKREMQSISQSSEMAGT